MTDTMENTRDKQLVERLRNLSTADRTALKRSLGRSLQEADAKAMAAFYKVYLRDNPWEEEVSFAVACGAAAFYNCSGAKKELPARLKELGEKSDGVENKLLQFLNIPLQPSTFFAVKLGRVLRMLLSKEKNVDFAALLKDLRQWEHPSHFVQLKWARVYYGSFANESKKM